MEPNLITDPKHADVLRQLIQREPIFHHPEFGTSRRDLENMTDPAFWEVGASGRRYSREYVIEGVLKRYEDPNYRGIHSPPEDIWQTKDFPLPRDSTRQLPPHLHIVSGRTRHPPLHHLAPLHHRLENPLPPGYNCGFLTKPLITAFD